MEALPALFCSCQYLAGTVYQYLRGRMSFMPTEILHNEEGEGRESRIGSPLALQLSEFFL